MSDEQGKPWSTDLALMSQRVEHNLEMQEATIETMKDAIVELKEGQIKLIELTSSLQVMPQLIADVRNLQDEAIAHQSVFSSINDVKKYINRVLTIGAVGAIIMFYTSQYKESNQSTQQIVAEAIKQTKG